ncbi:MAG: ABC transporter permease [Chloroflexia bacterium]
MFQVNNKKIGRSPARRSADDRRQTMDDGGKDTSSTTSIVDRPSSVVENPAEEARSGERAPVSEQVLERRAAPAQVAIGLLAVVLFVLAWWAVTWLGNYPSFILPTPPDVAARLGEKIADGSLLGHVWTTGREAVLGFLLALALGLGIGYPIGRSQRVERFLSPYVAISQGLPVVALAPLLVLWFSDDLTRIVVIVALIVFFPILVNCIAAVRGIERSMLEVAKISGANFWQTIWYVELPLGLRPLLAGVKLGLTLAITGAVIGEFVSASSGLGFLLMQGRGLFDTTLVFVALVCLAALSLLAYTAVTLLERMLITWE